MPRPPRLGHRIQNFKHPPPIAGRHGRGLAVAHRLRKGLRSSTSIWLMLSRHTYGHLTFLIDLIETNAGLLFQKCRQSRQCGKRLLLPGVARSCNWPKSGNPSAAMSG